jgi:hypothetical protein
VNLIPARGVPVFRWFGADVRGPEEVVKSESTSHNPEKKKKRGMQFLLLIYENKKRFASGFDPAEMQEYQTSGKQHASAIKGGNALQPTTEAQTVRVRNFKALSRSALSRKPKSNSAASISWKRPTKRLQRRWRRKFPARVLVAWKFVQS